MENKTGTCYIIIGSTGCTCASCKQESFIEGPYLDLDKADEAATQHAKTGSLRSQYSNTGIYSLCSIEYEQLPDGRLIIDNTLLQQGFLDGDGYMFNKWPNPDDFWLNKTLIMTYGQYLPQSAW